MGSQSQHGRANLDTTTTDAEGGASQAAPPFQPAFDSSGAAHGTGSKASAIAVREGRLLLFWPLALHLSRSVRGAEDVADIVSATARRLARRGIWSAVPDPIAHIAPPEGDDVRLKRWQNDAYAEAMYFHEFVQSFLFRRQETNGGKRPFYLLRRNDIAAVRVGFGTVTRTLAVERLNLYLFRTGAAVLVLELHTPLDRGSSGWSLAEFQDFHDYFRRVYAPFFDSTAPDGRGPCSKTVDQVQWLGRNGEGLRGSPGGECPSGHWQSAEAVADVDRFINQPATDGRRFPPIFGHWRFLLAGALPFADEGNSDEVWHQIVDERMPSMATVSLTPVQQERPVWKLLGRQGREEADRLCRAACAAVREGDLMRLCFADDRGDAAYPYDREFLLREFWSRNAYTRFASMGTLYLLSGYAFVAIGAGYEFDNHVTMHMRRHYFQIGLLTQVELASLLAFSSQISRSVRKLDSTSDQDMFRLEMSALEEQFLQFVHRFRFTGVSNQVQAQEIHEKWRSLLRLDDVFREVQNEIHTANEFLASRMQTRMTVAATTLSQIATVGVVLGLAFSMLGMNVVFGERGVPEKLSEQFALVIGTVGGFMIAGGGLIRHLARDPYGASSSGSGSRLAYSCVRPSGSATSEEASRSLAGLLIGCGIILLLTAFGAWLLYK